MYKDISLSLHLSLCPEIGFTINQPFHLKNYIYLLMYKCVDTHMGKMSTCLEYVWESEG